MNIIRNIRRALYGADDFKLGLRIIIAGSVIALSVYISLLLSGHGF